jgi:hypothetical protein
MNSCMAVDLLTAGPKQQVAAFCLLTAILNPFVPCAGEPDGKEPMDLEEEEARTTEEKTPDDHPGIPAEKKSGSDDKDSALPVSASSSS